MIAKKDDKIIDSKELIIERDTIICVQCKKGKGNNAVTKVEHFRVLTIFEKYYNKWCVSLDNKKTQHPKYQKGKYRVEARMMRKTLDGYEDYQPDKEGWGIKNIYIICDAEFVMQKIF